MLNAIEKQNATELDYRNEANNLLEVSSNMTRHGFQPREIKIPRPLSEMTTTKMIVMDLLPGPKLIEGVREYYSMYAQQQGTTLADLEQEAIERIEKEGFPTKYVGPSALQISLYRQYLKMRDSFLNFAIATYNGTAGWVAPALDYRQSSPLPPNIPRMIDLLMRVHGQQLLNDGVFNSGTYLRRNLKEANITLFINSYLQIIYLINFLLINQSKIPMAVISCYCRTGVLV